MSKFSRLFIVVTFLFVAENLSAQEMRSPYNSLILSIIKEMPVGGGYDTSNSTFKLLKSSMTVHDGHLVFARENTTPSFCSASTYQVFLRLIEKMQTEKRLSLGKDIPETLMITGQPDGSGVWGRWNANGPGTARLFHELGLGINFTDIALAQPGDFMKAFWSDEIGVKERGHSVVFTGTKENGAKICFWSSNLETKEQPAGMGEKCLAKEKFHRMIFSRLQSLENLNQIPKKMAANSPTYSDKYLADMLKRSSTPEEMCAEIGCR
ncbi:MAG: hypothetical protein JSU04_10555 [Bdellovibrionales bacterium]|nr:hypothetical protein [Bdellovibrionales bacterium]